MKCWMQDWREAQVLAQGRPISTTSASGQRADRARSAGRAHSMSPSTRARKTPIRRTGPSTCVTGAAGGAAYSLIGSKG